MKALLLALPLPACLIFCASCDREAKPLATAGMEAPALADSCASAAKVSDGSPFVFVTAPVSGAEVASGFEVAGCSRTFESTVNWTLKGKDGAILATGHANGGGVDGPAPFRFKVDYTAPAQIGVLEVYEEDPSDGEGSPRPKSLVSVVLKP